MKTPHLLGCDPKIKRKLNKPYISVTQWTFTPASAISIPNNSTYNLFSHVDFVEGGANVVKLVSGFGELFIDLHEGEKAMLFDRIDGDEAITIRCQLDFSFAGGQTRSIEVSILRPTLTPKVAPFLIARLDNSYLTNASFHSTFAIGDNDNFYVHGAYPSIQNLSGATMTISKISILVNRVFEGIPI
jgi:hypothetical protein